MRSLRHALECRVRTYRGIYHDVGVVLNEFSTDDLYRYVRDNLNMETALRYYLETQIVASEAEKLTRRAD